MDWPISDIATADIDGDGELEIATIEPFHGCHFRVYKKIGGNYKMIYEHPEVSEFYHVAVGGMLRNRPIFIGGCRRGKQQLFYIDCCKKSPLILEAKTIEEGVGPSNAIIINEPDRDIIACANREKGEAALYIISD
jgi:hypothetical protein